MGKIKWNTKGADVDAVEVEDQQTFEAYDGAIPPKNSVLRLALKLCYVQQFGTGNSGLKMLWEVSEPKSSPKARYNGCPVWEQLVDIDTQDFKIRQFMDAIGGSGKHWDNTMTAKDDKDRDAVVKWGNIKAEGLTVRVQTKQETYENEKQCKVQRYLPLVEDSGDDFGNEQAAGAGDDEPPF